MRIEALNVLPGDQLPGEYTALVKDAFLRRGEVVIVLEFGTRVTVDGHRKIEVARGDDA